MSQGGATSATVLQPAWILGINEVWGATQVLQIGVEVLQTGVASTQTDK